MNWITRNCGTRCVLVDESGEILAEITQGINWDWHYKTRSFINEEAAKSAAKKDVKNEIPT